MSDPTFTRRSSYGPTSPTVGERGARTRQQILDAALQCFTERGFHATSVEDIAVAAEISRATLYQYFDRKDAIFIELMHESGNTLIEITRSIGRLGPDAEGYANMVRWVASWSANFDRFAPMFVEWTNVTVPESPLRAGVAKFVDAYAGKVSKLLVACNHLGADPAASAILVEALMNRYNYIRYVYRPGLSAAQHLAAQACALQLFLFPDTPLSVLAAEQPAPTASTPPPVSSMGPLAILPKRDTIVHHDPFDGLSQQAAATARHLLDAAGRVFAANGYHAANIDQVVAEAGLARGTFYRYFSGKIELITALSHEAAEAMRPMFESFPAIAADPAALRSWLESFLALQQRYTGVLRAWTEGFPIEPALLDSAADVVVALSAAVELVFGPERSYPLVARAAGMLFSGLLEHFPDEGRGTSHQPSNDLLVETQALFIERALLPG